MTNLQQYELLKTVNRLLGGTLERDGTDQLAQRLVDDPAAHMFFLQAVALDVDLEWSCGGRATQGIFQAAPIPAATKPEASTTSPALAALHKPRLTPSLLSRTVVFFSRPVLQYAALVALCLYGSFVLIAWNLRSDKLPNGQNRNDLAVARVSNSDDVQWPHKVAPKLGNSLIHQSERLRIELGTMELELNTGTKLVVQGPADWSIDGNNSVSLRTGKLAAHVPPQAIGFTVETVTAKIVDLGTDFGVEVDDAGRTDVEVLAGKVDVHYEASPKSDRSRQTVRLSAGEAKQFSKRTESAPVTAVDVKPGTKSWVAKSISKLADTSKVQVLLGEARLILSLNADAGVTNTSSAPAANGDSIGTWIDQSGNNNNATKLEAITAPVLQTNALNSRAVVTFAASGPGDSGQELVISPLTGNVRGQQFTVFLVGKIDGNQAVTAKSSDYFFDGIDEDRRIALGLDSSNKLSFFGSQSINYLREEFGDSTVDSMVWTDYHIYQVFYKGASSALFMDGELKVPVATGHAGDAPLTSMLLGARYNHGYALNGAIANVQIYAGALSKAQENKIGAALQNYYGIKGNYVEVSESK